MPVMLVPLLALGVGILLSVRQPEQIYRYLGLSLIIVSAGFLFAQFETSRADSPFLKYPITTDMVALVEWQEKRVNGVYLGWDGSDITRFHHDVAGVSRHYSWTGGAHNA